MDDNEKLFRVVGFGETGYASLYAFVPFAGEKLLHDLAIDRIVRVTTVTEVVRYT